VSGAKPRAKRSAASRADTSGRREIGRVQANKAVHKRDPRCHRGTSPNSRLSRRQTASSHLQVRDKTMFEPIYVGIDVAKDTLISHLLHTQSLANTPGALSANGNSQRAHTIALIVSEATGGYERNRRRTLTESLPVVVVNPRQVRFSQRAWDNWQRPIP
jgi:hypothetical protein